MQNLDTGDKAPTIETTALAPLQPGDAIIADLNEKFGSWDLSTKSEKEVVEALKEIKKARTGIEGTRKTVVSEIVKVQKKVNGEAERLTTSILLLENRFGDHLTKLADEKRAVEERERQAKLEAFNARTNRLFEAGFTYDGLNYVAGTVFISVDEISEIDDAGFDTHLEEGRKQAERIKEMLKNFQNMPTTGAGVLTHVRAADPTPDDDITEVEFEENPPEHTDESEYKPLFVNKAFDEDDLPFGDGTGQALDPLNPLDADVLRVFGGNAIDRDDPASFRPSGYSMGFEACRAKVLELLETGQPIKKADLIEKIKSLAQ